MGSRAEYRADEPAAPGPLEVRAALILERLEQRKTKLARECPEALELTAIALAAMQQVGWLRAAAIQAPGGKRRNGRQVIAMWAGEKPLDLTELMRQWLVAPEVVEAGLRAALATGGVTLTRAELTPDCRRELAAELARAEATIERVRGRLRLRIRNSRRAGARHEFHGRGRAALVEAWRWVIGQ